MPRVCIGIPTYNSSKYLRQTMESSLRQSYTDFELIVSDDCSQDNTREIVAEYTDPRVRLDFDGQRRGLVGNWNRCLELAHSTYVCVLNHDDVMDPDNLALKVALLDAHPEVGFVFSDIKHIDATDAITHGHWTPEALPGSDTVWQGAEFFRLILARGNLVSGSSVVMRRSLVERIGGFDPRLYFTLDLEMWLRLSLHSDVGYVAAPLVHLRRHDKQVTTSFIGNGREVEQVWRAVQIVFTEQQDLIAEPEAAFKIAVGHLLVWTRMLARLALRAGQLRAAATYVRQNIGFYRVKAQGLAGLRSVAG